MLGIHLNILYIAKTKKNKKTDETLHHFTKVEHQMVTPFQKTNHFKAIKRILLIIDDFIPL